MALTGCDQLETAPAPTATDPVASSAPAQTQSGLQLGALTLNVVGPDGEAVTDFRWLIEEDATRHVVPGVVDPAPPSVSFHKSFMPVLAHGDSQTAMPSLPLDPTKRYFLSVLPASGYALGGSPFRGSDSAVSVRVTRTPLPTSQVSVYVFEDNSPINNAPDLPAERGLEGFEVILREAGGRYGMSGGQVMQDVWGNPLGTTYMPDGSVHMMGDGTIFTDATGNAIIKNLSQGKFTVTINAPRGEGWVQTSTIEGGRGVDAWVKPNEPRFFQEFGPPSWHTFFGFVRETNDTSVLTGGSTIRGKIVNLHLSPPPLFGFNAGESLEYTSPYVGLNELSSGTGRGVWAKQTDEDGTFSIPNVPPGVYQLVVWDAYLDLIFAFHTLTVPADGSDVRLGKVPVFQWFGQLYTFVFHDENGNGVQEDGELGIPEVGVTIRWRDGSIYQQSATDVEGFLPFNEIFPFFAWQVLEVDTSRFKLTGPTVVVDAGGAVDPNDPWSYGLLTPQPQPENGGLPYRTEAEPMNTVAFQSFIGSTSVVSWGKQPYDPTTHENGGIAGAVWYDIMRGADDARNGGQELMETGIPHVQINLYRDGVAHVPPDVDNWPTDNFPGPEDIDRNANDTFDYGDAIAVTHSLGWDENLPTGCTGAPFIFRGVQLDCFDGLRNYNQVRPGVYDGMYAFSDIPAGVYIVEVVSPTTAVGDVPYQVTREEDQNLDFGEEYAPSPLQLPPECAGALHTVPNELLLFPGITPRYAGRQMPLCDRKRIRVNDGQKGAVDFFLFTEVPISAHIAGAILDDTANEFDPNAPTFGEKFAPPWIPISIRDWDGTEISRTYSDEYGVYNALVPSTFTMNNPLPSGVAPKMLTTCMNDPGPIPDPQSPGRMIIDPHYNPQYSQSCYQFQYLPGSTTYLDTPVVPVAAFAGPAPYPLDCEAEDGTPRIHSVSGPGAGGPYVASTGVVVTITSDGPTPVLNPAYDGANGTQPKMITRDFGFGNTPGTVSINGRLATILQWTDAGIRARVNTGTTTGQLTVTRGDNGRSTLEGVTLTVGRPTDTFRVRRVPARGKIQPVIDAARVGDLILVPPGEHFESLILWKPVRLQGWGPGSTHINAVKAPSEKLVAWREQVMSLIDQGVVSLLPNQQNAAPDPNAPLESATLFSEEGPGVLVLGRSGAAGVGGRFGMFADGLPNARIDGFTISGGENAGGITVNGYAHNLVISNNRIQGNAGTYGGGVRLGHPYLFNAAETGYQSAFNDRVRVHHNNINRNGGLEGAGGGISLYTGSDNYVVEDNFICGNFQGGHGGGIGHLGLSPSGRIQRNTITFNEIFYQASAVHGAGLFIGGGAPRNAGDLSPGSGSVTVDRNLIQGNGATSGDGGGIAILRANGADVVAARNNPDRWFRIDLTNNIIMNNVAALAGGGIALQDAARVNIVHNTIAYNDSTATAGDAFAPGNPSESIPQPAGIVARGHSTDLAAAFGPARAVDAYRVFSNPRLTNDVIWQNRSFHFLVSTTLPAPGFGLVPDVAGGAAPQYWDLGVLGASVPSALAPTFCDLTVLSGGLESSNFSAPPRLRADYFNGSAAAVAPGDTTTGIAAPAAFDEGGNFIKVRFGPITIADPVTGDLLGDAHLQPTSPLIRRGLWLLLLPGFPQLAVDFDGRPRPAFPTQPDVGALQR